MAKGVLHFFSELEEFDERHGGRFWKAGESDFRSHAHELGAVKMYRGCAEYDLGQFLESRDKIREGIQQLDMALPSSGLATTLSLGSWAFSTLAMGRKPRANPAKWEKKFGAGPATSALVKDLAMSFGALAQSLILTDAPVTQFLHAVAQMYNIACSIDDPESVCAACGWLTTAFAIAGATKIADRYCKEASNLADLHPTTACVAAASYSAIWVSGNKAKHLDAYHAANAAYAAYLELGDLRRAHESMGTS
jgi:hypothetical protein